MGDAGVVSVAARGTARDASRGLKAGGLRKIWRSELRVASPQRERGMYGSGMLVINRPGGWTGVWRMPWRA